MDIIIRKPYLILKPVTLNDLPDFIILTGENGTGKTQFLNYLYMNGQLDISMPANPDILFPIPQPEPPCHTLNENGSESFEYAAEININNQRVNNIIYRAVHTPEVNLGNNFSKNNLLKEGQEISQKFFYYKTTGNLNLDDPKNIESLNHNYLDALGFKKSPEPYRNQGVSFPSFKQADINFIKKIIEIHKDVDPYLIPYYYIAYKETPNSTIFSANLKFLYIQYWARKQAALELGESPWETFNKIAQAANFRYLLDIPDVDDQNYDFDIKLRDIETGTIVNADSLSSGEKVILSLILAIYSSNTGAPTPNVILFDEPDAYLHPSFCKQMLDVIQQVLVEEYNIKVIMTTHSPTTVALSPEIGLYRMNRELGCIVKTDKKEAIRSLMCGLNSISIFYKNIKQIFVEASFDKYYLEQIYDLVQNKYLEKDIVLHFITVGSDQKTGGCETLKTVVKALSASPNSMVYGIIDWDLKNNSSDRIRILGNSQRYAIENYVFDPIGVAILILSENYEIERLGFSKSDTLLKFKEKKELDIQNIINKIIAELECNKVDLAEDKSQLKYTTINGMNFYIPKWFATVQGHSLKDLYIKTYPFLNRHKDIGRKITEISYRNFPEFIPNDIVLTLKDIQTHKI